MMRPPKQSLADKGINIAKALLADIVPLGGTVGELAALFMQTPYERRIDGWQSDLGAQLDELARKHDAALEDLQADPGFVDTVMHATQVAIRNANEEKREALRNAILNTALPHPPEESERQIFLNYVDSFTPWHLRLLSLFKNPKRWFEAHGLTWPENTMMGSRSKILELAYPEAKQCPDLVRQVWRDLHATGMVGTDSLSSSMSGSGLTQAATTPLGRRFIEFVSAPEESGPAPIE